MKKLMFLAILVAVPTIVMATVSTIKTPEPQETLKEKQKRHNEIYAQFEEEGVPQEIAVGPHIKLGKAAKWVINNANKPDGWSLSGYASLKIDKSGNMSRWKIGIINGELDWNTYQELEDRRIPNFELLEEWNQRKTNGIVFGIFFCKEF